MAVRKKKKLATASDEFARDFVFEGFDKSAIFQDDDQEDLQRWENTLWIWAKIKISFGKVSFTFGKSRNNHNFPCLWRFSERSETYKNRVWNEFEHAESKRSNWKKCLKMQVSEENGPLHPRREDRRDAKKAEHERGRRGRGGQSGGQRRRCGTARGQGSPRWVNKNRGF